MNAAPANCIFIGAHETLQDKDYGLSAFVFEDPDGNRIDVGQPI